MVSTQSISSQPKIIILRGNSGSGKTTIAKELQQYLGKETLLLSQDVIRREMLYADDGPESKAIKLIMQLIKYGKENCKVIILEGILYADWYRDLFEMIRNEFDKEIYSYYFKIPFEETLKRHKTKSNGKDFGENEMKNWWREEDYINIIPEKIITQDMTIGKVVSMISNDMKLHRGTC